MPYVIAEPCNGCLDTACVDVCPMDCIVGVIPVDQLRLTPRERRNEVHGRQQLYIDPEQCIDCGACVSECPADAIFPDDQLPPQWSDYAAINADFFKRR